ncbi:MAG: hypothetical protein LC798_13540 [Chloroflexi bacterium]|nr:hypothetical protein [Chloroflexota bacterium]
MGKALAGKGTCGAYGGRTRAGRPCRNRAGAGTPRATGLCSTHETTVELAALTAAALEVEQEPTEDWLAGIGNPKKRAFLTAFARIGTAVGAEEASGTSESMHSEWKRPTSRWHDPLYAEAFLVAKEKAAERLEHEARRRAIVGVRRPELYQGQQVLVEARNPDGTVVLGPDGKAVLVPLMRVEYSDTLLIALMNANLPGKFKYRHEHAGPGGGPIPVAQVIRVHIPDNGRAGPLPEEVESEVEETDGHRNGRPGGDDAP